MNNKNWIQSCITTVSFPDTLDGLAEMVFRNSDSYDTDDLPTDLELLLNFQPDWDLSWTAPKWFTQGDILFFYHAVKAKQRIRSLLKQAREVNDNELIPVLTRADQLADRYSGRIFGCAEATSVSTSMSDNDLSHFKSRVFAPLRKVFIFDTPLSADRFANHVKINRQGTLTYLGKSEFEGLRHQLSIDQNLPDYLRQAEFSESGFRNINQRNWVSIISHEKTKFLHETQVRSYFIDYLLDELKDEGSPLLEECHCFRNKIGTGLADYFIKISGKWIPVEAKLNIKAEENLHRQLKKYIHIDSFIPTKGNHKGIPFPTHNNPTCIVIDQSGLYLTYEGQFHTCAEHSPFWERTDLEQNRMQQLRNQLREHIQSS